MGSNETSSNSTPLTADQRKETYNAGMEQIGEKNLPGGYVMQQYQDPRYTRANYVAGNAATNVSLRDPGNANDATYQDAGDARTFGDYDKLEQSIYNSRTAGLAKKEQDWRKQADEDLAKRGIYSSGVAVQAQNKITEGLASEYAAAAAEAANQRYGLQSNELAQLNAYGQNRANSANTFNMQKASMLNDYGMQRAGMANDFNLSNANRTDNFNADRYRQLNEANRAEANSANTFALNNAQAKNAFTADQAKQNYEAQWRPADYKAGIWNGTGGVVSSSSGGGWSI